MSGKGAMKRDTGEPIEYPADLIRSLIVDVQGYGEAALDAGELSRFYSACLKNEIRVATVMEGGKVKEFLDELALNIHAHWLISDGKSVMRLRGIVEDSPVRYDFTEAELDSPEITSEDLYNEVTVNFGYDFADGKFTGSITKHNPLSEVIYGASRMSRDLKMIQATRQAENVADAVLKTFSIPQLKASFKGDSKSVYVEPGDRVSLTDSAGIGDDGFVAAPGIVTGQSVDGDQIAYDVTLEGDDSLYQSDLVNLCQAVGASTEKLTVTYENGVATITIYADVQGSPPVEGAEATISGVKKITDKKGQARFNVQPGRYTARISASGYEDAEIEFSV